MECNTLIIGGGITGLYLAEQLAKRGDDVLLLEKNPYFGGRVYTFRDRRRRLEYEAGAGRIHRRHRLVAGLVRRFGLRTYSFTGEAGYADVFAGLYRALSRLPQATLRRHTIADLIPPAARHILKMYPYWAETHLMRADVALASFAPRGVMMDTAPDAFYGIVGGIDMLTQRLIPAARREGARLLTGHAVHDVRRIAPGHFEAMAGPEASPKRVTARRVIFATCRCSLGQFRLLRGEPFLDRLATSPLLRIYAVYPVDSRTGQAWFADLPMTVTAGPLRFVIPINARKGLIMISYTDGADTVRWRDLDGAALTAAIQAEVHRMWPDRHVPAPTYLRKHYWSGGCTYWLPGDYDVERVAAAASNPSPDVYVCGESVSVGHQAWIEGSLETVDKLLRRL